MPDATISASTKPAHKTLSEEESKELLRPFGVRFPAEAIVRDPDGAAAAADELGLPVVAKLNGDNIAHKTERGLVRLGLASSQAVRDATTELLAAATPKDGEVSVLVAPMIPSNREFICGVSIDPQFGPIILIGIGGILTEAIADVVLRLVPITRRDAEEMIDEIRTQDLLGSFRGEVPVDRSALADLLLALSTASQARSDILAIDLNPVLIHDGTPIAVDALVELSIQ